MYKKASKPAHSHSRSGFTLIELLVSISILIMLVGVGIAALVRQNDRQKLLQSARSAQQFLKVARAKAQSKQTPDGAGGCVANESLIATQVILVGNTQLDMKAICSTAAGPARAVEYDSESSSDTFTFPTNVVFETGFPAGSGIADGIQFVTLSGGTNQTGDVEVVLRLSGSENGFRFTVGRLGRIDEGAFCDFTIAHGEGSCLDP